MDAADFARRTSADWFDPAGLFVAERDGRIIGFHWTKVEDGIGEVYVVGIDPDAQGGGLGTALTARGLRHLHDQGLPIVDLYVEGDNTPALKVYRRLGFEQHAKDVLYSPQR
jgi:mycothiol synthase